MATQPNSAYDLLASTLKAWGLSTLVPDAKKFLTAGYTSDEITIQLQNTAAYKTRFAANTARQAAGLPTLTPAEYIGLEDSYRQVMRQYGLPSGFYDKPTDFTKFIAGDVSPTELQSRVALASQSYTAADPEHKANWQRLFGLTSGDAVAAILDPKTALPLLQQKAAAVDVASAASQSGITISKGQAVQFGNDGVTLDAARKAYADVANNLATGANLGDRFGIGLGEHTLATAELDPAADHAAAARIQTASDEEQGLFHANPGANSASLATQSSY